MSLPVRLGFKFTKFKKLDDGRLEVEGLASDETIDSQGDIVDYEGLKRAAAMWRGNLREQHDPKKAVGKALDVTFDDEKRAMFVRSFISAGAPETQAKILDGTIGSYSVGGSNPTSVKYEQIDGKTVRRVLDWQMSELSVVDAPANPNANFDLCKADGAGAFVATEILAEESDAEPLVEAVGRFGKAILNEINKGKKSPLVNKPPKQSQGDALTAEQKKPAQGAVGATGLRPFQQESQSGGTGVPPPDGGTRPTSNVATSAEVAQSAAAKDPAAEDVERQGAAPGTARQSSEVEGTVSIPPSVPVDITPAEGAEGEKSGKPSADHSAAPVNPAAEDVAGAGTGKPAADQSAAPKTPAEAVEAEKTGTGAGPAPSSDKLEDTAEASGSDTEKDLLDGKKKRSPKGTPAAVPTTGKSAKSAERELLTKYFYGTKGSTLADAAELVKGAVALYGPEDPRADLLALAASALVKFVGADTLEHVPDAVTPTPMPAGNQGAQPTTKDEDAEQEPDGDELSPPADPPDRFMPMCEEHGIANCDKCAKEEEAADGMEMATNPRFTKALMPLVMREFARQIAQKFVPADAQGVFKVNHGDQMAEGIGKGLSVVTTGVSELASEVAVVKTETAEIAKALTEFKGLTAELKGMRESVEALSKTAAVPVPLRTVPGASLEKSSPSAAEALEAFGNGITDPELKAKFAQHIAIVRASGK